MHFRPQYNAALLAILLSACVQNATNGTSDRSTNFSCSGFIDIGSALETNINLFRNQPTCEKRYHPGGEGHIESYSLAGVESHDAASGVLKSGSQLWVFIFRHYGEAEAPHLDANTFEHVEGFRQMPDKLPVELTGVTGPATASRFELPGSSITMVCLDPDTANADGSHTVVGLCRSVGKQAADAAVVAMARSIATRDLPAINP
jgi:hypothetical protein